MSRRWMMLGLGALTLQACGPAGADLDQTGVGKPPLPRPQETLLPPMKIATPKGWEEQTPLVPEGFRITALASDLKVPRQTLVLPNGDVLVAEGSGGGEAKLRPKDFVAGFIKARGKTSVKGGDRVTLLRDADGDGRAETRSVLIDGLNAPYGLAYVEGRLYVADQDALLSVPLIPGQTRVTVRPERLTALPSLVNHHWTKSLTVSADGAKLYVGIGSNSNVDERGLDVEQDRAQVWEIDRLTGAHRVLASGVRNPTALAIEPRSARLWLVANERDELGPRLAPDYLTAPRDGGFYGWPYSYWGQNVDPRVRPQKPDLVAQAIVPDYALGSHVAPLGLAFAQAGAFGEPFAEGAFVGEHGSWNRQDPAGYKVVWVPFANGRPTGKPRDFVTGFLGADGHARGRPVGVTYDPERRRLLIADDLSNTVWRVTRAQPAPTAPQGAGPLETSGGL